MRDWTLWAMAGPWLATLAGSPVEYLWARREPPLAWVIGGAGLVAVGIGIRWKARRDLGDSFRAVVRVPEGAELVRRGLYATIRHPLYLGHTLVMVGVPLLLGCRWAWIPATLGVAATLVRSVVEERYLAEKWEGYREYMGQTWRFLPYVW
jgi:protein-S-isoprenylcysteine O-methyltransferase Ste14